MIDTLWIFGKRNVWKHLGLILGTTHPYLAGLVSCYLVFRSDLSIRPYALAGFFLPYDTVVFGFTATAIALAIAIPSTHFVRFLSSSKNNSTAFRDFLFILAWNGVVHIIAFLMFVPFIFLDEKWVLLPAADIDFKRLYVFFLIWTQLYSCAQFLVTTLTVFELADLYAQFSAKEREGGGITK